jgi:hypothetical protein
MVGGHDCQLAAFVEQWPAPPLSGGVGHSLGMMGAHSAEL